MRGKRRGPAAYRDGQNVIHEAATGRLVYLPPEASEVPSLMHQLVGWMHQAERDRTPVVLVAALAHYQFVTIHPYYDGNGRTARLLATFLLHRGGYGLGGIFSLEEYHSRDIEAYYRALEVGGHHNYYMGRSEADLTDWIEYFVRTLTTVFEAAKEEALKHAGASISSEPEELRRLNHRTKTVLSLFARQEQITSAEVAMALGLSERMARWCLSEWVQDGWLVVSNPSRRACRYALREDLRP